MRSVHQAGSTRVSHLPATEAPATSGREDLEPAAEVYEYLHGRGLASDHEDGARMLRKLLELHLRFPDRRVSVRRAARISYVSRRTLGRICKKAGLPPPSRILAFGRILNTVRLLRRPARTIAEAAYDTGWPDPFSFSNAMNRLTGLRPSEARERGPLYMAELWLRRELSDGNAELREPRPPRCLSCGHVIEADGSGDPEPRAEQLRIL